MLRCRLSTVRTLGGHDRRSYPWSSSFFTPTTPRFSRVHVAPAVDLPPRLEDPNKRRIERAWNSRSAIDSLRRYLSSEYVTSTDPFISSPTVLRSLYYRAESRSQLEMLDSGMLTRLIGILGSLSVDPHTSTTYSVPLSPRLLGVAARRTHWAFMLKVGKYKLERGLPLHDSDRFWLMRAELAIAQASPPSEPFLAHIYRAILRARKHYHVIRRHSRHPEIHAHYLKTLLAIPDPRLLDFAARDLSFLLRTQYVCHRWLQRLLCLLVIKHGDSLPTQSQEAILAAFWSRVCQKVDGPSAVLICSQSDTDHYRLDATMIARSLSISLFGVGCRLPLNKSVNSYHHLFSVFSPEYALPLRWSSLISLAVFNSAETPHIDCVHCTSDHANSLPTLCWQVTFGLAILERNAQQRTLSMNRISEATRNLYQRWLPVARLRLVSPDLACMVATSFLKMASVLLDMTLFYDCQSLYCAKYNSEDLPMPVRRQFATQYTATAVRIQGALPGVVLSILDAFSLDLEQQRQVTTSAIEILAPTDASLAYTLYTVAKENGMEPDPDAAHTLAMSLAQSGALRQAIEFFNHSQSSPEKRGILVGAIARNFRDNPQIRQPLDVYVAILDEITSLYRWQVPPEHFRGHLEQLFVILAQNGRGSQLFPVVVSIFGRSPGFFHPRFFDRYYRVLAQHRQFTTASKLIDVIAVVYPKIARSLSILASRTGTQTGAFRVFIRNSLPRGLASLGLSSRLRRRPSSGYSNERYLLSSGRVHSAKRIFTRVIPALPSKRCTTLGNMLLHELSRRPTSRNGRRVRKVLALLESLIHNHNFQPDRVTVNTLVKVLIGWRLAFDSPRLRELFDQLVRGGYPAAEYSALHPPFGTQQTLSLGWAAFSKLPSFVSFEKHAKPLFKMLIKAFYLRNDVEAARKVVGILKVEAYKNAVAKETRRSARSRGRVKAASKQPVKT